MVELRRCLLLPIPDSAVVDLLGIVSDCSAPGNFRNGVALISDQTVDLSKGRGNCGVESG